MKMAIAVTVDVMSGVTSDWE